MKKSTRIHNEREVEVRHYASGIVTVYDGRGYVGSVHANIHKTGSVRGMKNLGYWRREARCVPGGEWVYNIDTYVVTDELDELAAELCQCKGCLERRTNVHGN